MREAEQIVSAVRQNGHPVWYIRFEDEGHGPWNWDHDAYVKYAQILFLNRYLVGGADKDLFTRLP